MQLTPKSSLHFSETGRDENVIHFDNVFANGDLGEQLNGTGTLNVTGSIIATPTTNGCYNITLTVECDMRRKVLELAIEAKLLIDDQAFFGYDRKSNDGILLLAEQDGGYVMYVYQDGKNYTETWYNHLKNYNGWAIENGHPTFKRNNSLVNSICEAFPKVNN